MATFRRPGCALAYLDVLDRQTHRPDEVLVIDNGCDAELAAAIASRTPSDFRVRYISPAENIGPAGAFRLGFDELKSSLGARDLIVHLDDDDPPVADDQLARLIHTLEDVSSVDPTVGAVGLSGGRLDTRLGRVRAVARSGTNSEQLVEVDHLHGGYTPIYVVGALARVGANDPSFYFGFEELEVGRRMSLGGSRLLVDQKLMSELLDRYPKRSSTVGRSSAFEPPEVAWSRFHKERNLIRILRREHRWSAIIFTFAARHVGRPLLRMPIAPTASWRRLLLGVRATIAGLRDEGGIDPRYQPPNSGRPPVSR